MGVWVQWQRDGKRSVAHMGVWGVQTGDIRNGDFPLTCGKWAPSGFDALMAPAVPNSKRCDKCQKVADKHQKRPA